MPTLTTAKAPTLGGGASFAAEVNRAEFEGGYSQRSRPGPNSVRRTETVEWRGLTSGEKDAILAFFEARGGSEAFDWTPPGESAALLWTCASWSRAAESRSWSVSATFVQEFDLTE